MSPELQKKRISTRRRWKNIDPKRPPMKARRNLLLQPRLSMAFLLQATRIHPQQPNLPKQIRPSTRPNQRSMILTPFPMKRLKSLSRRKMLLPTRRTKLLKSLSRVQRRRSPVRAHPINSRRRRQKRTSLPSQLE